MNNTLSTQFEQYGTWRASVLQSVGEFQDWLQAQELYDAQADMRAQRIRGVLRSDKLKVAFIAEFSRGKSELINAIFFADFGRRILPSSAGRTTMCPTELMYDESYRSVCCRSRRVCMTPRPLTSAMPAATGCRCRLIRRRPRACSKRSATW